MTQTPPPHGTPSPEPASGWTYPPPPGGPYPPPPPPGVPFSDYRSYAPQVGWPAQPIPAPRVSGLAVASLVLGILWFSWIGSVLALIFGYMARREIDASGGLVTGRGLAVAGIVLGWIGIGVLALFILGGLLAALAVVDAAVPALRPA